MNIIKDKFVIKRLPMMSSQHEAEKRIFRKYIGKSGRVWFVAIQENSADNIYVTNNPKNTTNSKQGFEGFGGATLKLPLDTGEIFELHGGWKSNSVSLFCDTDIDIRDKNYTRVIISLKRSGENCNTVLEDILYFEKNYQLGEFKRGEILAKDIANKLKKIVFCYSESQGGSSCGLVYPD